MTALEPYAGKCVVMWTSYVSSPLFEVAWRKLQTTLDGKSCQYQKIDGAAPENKEARTALWEISGVRGYPQVFADVGSGLEYIGDMDMIQDMLDGGRWQEKMGKFCNINDNEN